MVIVGDDEEGTLEGNEEVGYSVGFWAYTIVYRSTHSMKSTVNILGLYAMRTHFIGL